MQEFKVQTSNYQWERSLGQSADRVGHRGRIHALRLGYPKDLSVVLQ
jgi:hypothetical protein